MKNKNISRTANKFIKILKGEVEFSCIENYLLTKYGFKLIFFNTPSGDAELLRYGMVEKAKSTNAFSYTGTAKIIFINNSVSSEDKLYLLLHETGHIVLEHFSNNKLLLKNKLQLDIEADAFAYAVLHPSNKRKLIACIVSFIAVAFLSFYIGYTTAPTQLLPTSATEQTTEQVYITSTGKKYHRSNCRYVKGKDNIAVIDKKQADKTHSPCSVCNP